jgi:[acyl-carrier-protein] S-malonyltransferase/trans-AT polyketide synthase/acyltransferase/oxidoreductase domain-containing protein
MTRIAVVFPGQGSQRAGMGLDLAERFAVSAAVFDQASQALGLDLREIVSGGDGRLGLTEYTQPALLTVEIAILRALEAHRGFLADIWAGHSLGEYTALCAAGALPLDDAVRLVRARGRLMQETVPAGEGGMLAVAARGDLPLAVVQGIAAECEVDIANHNSGQQVVLSGRAEALEAARERCRAAGLRGVPLPVSAPFHSRLMGPVAERFRPILEEVAPRFVPERAARVLSNVTGDFHAADRGALVAALTRQIPSTVRWRDTMARILATSDRVWEVGPTAPLGGFFKTLGALVPCVSTAADVEAFRPG